jgi:hypothetical protein
LKVIKRQDKKEVYTVIKRSKNCHAVVKVLNIYETEKQALQSMIELLQGNKTEDELLQEYIKKDS